ALSCPISLTYVFVNKNSSSDGLSLLDPSLLLFDTTVYVYCTLAQALLQPNSFCCSVIVAQALLQPNSYCCSSVTITLVNCCLAERCLVERCLAERCLAERSLTESL